MMLELLLVHSNAKEEDEAEAYLEDNIFVGQSSVTIETKNS